MKELETQLIEIAEEGKSGDRLHKGLRILAQIIARQISKAQEGGKQGASPVEQTPDEEV